MNASRDLTKGQRRELRRIRDLAYERELTAALSVLEVQFRRWRAGEIHAQDLSETIHEYHQGAAREIWSRYYGRSGLSLILVEEALETGVVAEHEVGGELLERIKAHLALSHT